ncbi:hypothetical protein HRI_003919600 [Hibiscus trionum]|uniref:PHD-type zinc finger plants domain-containing protein n=1 Tax=Hibiscus trionum TaxID=183268 RepID=A0A9W7IZ29_HIBTR|nr:hypothetical protein HRI_003919600 [Hibiscus trionum]
MAENKEEIISISQQSSLVLVECCMCGDSGLTQELFQCKICHFRSQHRYCSDLYPKAEFYRVCNWCLNQKEDSKDQRSQNSSNSSATWKDKNKRKKKDKDHGVGNAGSGQRSKDLNLQAMKKSSSPPPPPRKRIISNARLEEKLRRTKSEEISNGGFITRHVFRNKVRRYKLLDEVSS